MGGHVPPFYYMISCGVKRQLQFHNGILYCTINRGYTCYVYPGFSEGTKCNPVLSCVCVASVSPVAAVVRRFLVRVVSSGGVMKVAHLVQFLSRGSRVKTEVPGYTLSQNLPLPLCEYPDVSATVRLCHGVLRSQDGGYGFSTSILGIVRRYFWRLYLELT